MRLVAAVFGALLALVANASAQTSAYRLQPGDTINITVWQDQKLDRQVVVGPDGSISVPLVGRIQAGGQTLQAVEDQLRRKLQPNYSAELDVNVALSTVTAKENLASIFVTGEVNRPGSYPLPAQGTTALQAIALSGGFSPFAATRRIQIVRNFNGQTAEFTFNYDDFMSGRDLGGNIDLRAGDVVVVPEKGLFGH
jgi:polysaccharide export outer membrane protein